MPEDIRFFTAYSYRTSSRFGSHVDVCVSDGVVGVTGRRIPRWLRDAWIGAQAGIMGALIARLLFRRRGWFRVLVAEWAVAAFGALLLWWPSERGPEGLLHGVSREFRTSGTEMARRSYDSWSFRVENVRDVRVTPWYWRRGLWYVAWPWQLLMVLVPGERKTVVFDVLVADEPPRERLVFALQMPSAKAAEELAGILRSGSATPEERVRAGRGRAEA